MLRALAIAVVVRDEDTRTFEIVVVADPGDVLRRVAEAAACGRKVKGYTLAGDDHTAERERCYLMAKGYTLRSHII